MFFLKTGRYPNLKNPVNFNEKITKLKIDYYANNELITQCSDKYKVRDYVISKGHKDILNDIYGCYTKFEDIKFDDLPPRFALKCTHGSGYNIICDDIATFDYEKARKQVNTWMNETFGQYSQEYHYQNIEPAIIIEKHLSDGKGIMPIDYKIFCFNGTPKIIQVCTERQNKLLLNYFDTSWEEVYLDKPSYRGAKHIEKPRTLQKMLRVAKDLSGDFPFVRVDLYQQDEKVIFGELTFTPANGTAPHYTKKSLLELGEMLILPDTNTISVLVASLNKSKNELISKLNLQTDAIIINQTNRYKFETIRNKHNTIKYHEMKERGVGLSRNHALMMAQTDICIFADDDMEFVNNYAEIVLREFKANPKADILLFNVPSLNPKRPAHTIKSNKRVRKYNSLKYGASKFVVRLSAIHAKNVYFSLLFGGGAKYSSGEDSLFLYQALSRGMKIYTSTKTIGHVSQLESTWFNGYNFQYFFDKGALFAALSPTWYILLILQSVIRKRSVHGTHSFVFIFSTMLQGAMSYKKKNNEC
jgi:glycosyltransferase involved in cell wall biosynthesis